jgi:23S rRNA (adenine2503-C2)-methyltransferase
MNADNKINIRLLSLSDLEQFFITNNDKPFRGRQVHDWLWHKHALLFSEMTNLPKSSRQLLNDNFYTNQTKIDTIQKSNDGTIKVSFSLRPQTSDLRPQTSDLRPQTSDLRFQTSDLGPQTSDLRPQTSDLRPQYVEGVLIPEKQRITACISSQVGCALNCKFCATGQLGYKRDLGFDEIFDEYVLLNELSLTSFFLPLTSVVYMGMGEPLMNYDNVLKSIDKLTSADGLGISPRRITLSTVGIPSGIKKLADDKIKFNLAVSLHSASDLKRTSLAPVNKKYPLTELSEAIKYFHKITQSRITYEYLMLRGINDSIADARELAQFCRISPCKINLIEYNNNEIPGFSKSDPGKTKAFAEYLKRLNLVVNIRRSRGSDIKAACGQLANAYSNR